MNWLCPDVLHELRRLSMKADWDEEAASINN